MLDAFMPTSEQELSAFIAEAAQNGTPMGVCGRGTKRAIGRPPQTAGHISTAQMSGITLYEPTELVLSAHAGTLLTEIEDLLAENGQMLAFEPSDWSFLLGRQDTPATIGSIFAMNVSGPRRILRGAARDHILGVRAVNGRGEVIKWGGRVMKNVTGIDLARGLAGSWGTLAVMTEITMKVLPRPEEVRTLFLFGLPDEAAVAVLCAAMNMPYEVSGTIHLPASLANRLGDTELASLGRSITAIRIENFSASVDYRSQQIERQLSAFGEVFALDDERSTAFWRDIRDLKFLSESNLPLWRVTTAPDRAVDVVNAVRNHLDCQAAYDWSGGLIWLEFAPSRDADATELRRVIADFGAQALLVRAPLSVRSAVDVFHPLPEANMLLTQKLKEAFDPAGILNPGRMYPGI